MNNHLGDEAKKEVLDQSKGEAGLGPVMAPFENLQHIAVEVDLAVKVLLLESLNGNELLAVVSIAVFGLVEFEVVLDGFARKLRLLVLAGGKLGREPPEGSEDGEQQEEGEKHPRLDAHAPAPGNVCGHADEQRDEGHIVKRLAARALCWEGSIGNGWILCITQYQQVGPSCPRSMAGGAGVQSRHATYRSRLDAAVKLGRGGRGRRRRLDPLKRLLRGVAAHFCTQLGILGEDGTKVLGFGRARQAGTVNKRAG